MKRILATLAAPPSAASVENLLQVPGAVSSVSTMHTLMEDSMREKLAWARLKPMLVQVAP